MGVARRLALGRLISLSGGSAAYIALVASIYGLTHSAVWIPAAIFASVAMPCAAACSPRRKARLTSHSASRRSRAG
jgi:hypothetical protein